MGPFKSLFKPSLVDIAKTELYAAERALLSARVNKSFCESDIAYNTARIEHLRAAIAEKELSSIDTEDIKLVQEHTNGPFVHVNFADL